MKKVISLALVFILCLSVFCGCEKKSSIVGTWKASIDVGEYVKASIEESMQMTFDDKEYPMMFDLYLQFTKDGQYIVAFDEQQITDATKAFILDLTPEMVDNFYQQMETEYGLSREAADETIRTSTENQYNDLPSYVTALMEEFDYSQSTSIASPTGKYSVDDDTLIITTSENGVTEDNKLSYTLKEKTLTISGKDFFDGIVLGDNEKVVFTKVSDKDMPSHEDVEVDPEADTESTIPNVTEKDVDPDSLSNCNFEVVPNNAPCTLIDTDYMTISVKSIEHDVEKNWWDNTVINIEIVNKTEDSKLYVELPSAEIAGVLYDNFFYATVNAGNTSVEEITIDNLELSSMGFGGYNDIILYFTSELEHSDSTQETQVRDEFTEDPVTLNVNLASIPSAPQTIDSLSDNGVEIGYIGSKVDYSGDYIEYYLCKNTTENDITIESENCVINGYEVDTFAWMEILAGKTAVIAVEYLDIDDIGIAAEEIHNNLKIDFVAITYADWFADQIAVITYTGTNL